MTAFWYARTQRSVHNGWRCMCLNISAYKCKLKQPKVQINILELLQKVKALNFFRKFQLRSNFVKLKGYNFLSYSLSYE